MPAIRTKKVTPEEQHLAKAIKGIQDGTLKNVTVAAQHHHVTEVPHQSTLHTKARLDASINNHKMRDIYTKSIRIDKAVAAIQRGEFIHFNNAADHYKCSRNAVSQRMRGLTKSKKEANSF
jgi:hypothetical protein